MFRRCELALESMHLAQMAKLCRSYAKQRASKLVTPRMNDRLPPAGNRAVQRVCARIAPSRLQSLSATVQR